MPDLHQEWICRWCLHCLREAGNTLMMLRITRILETLGLMPPRSHVSASDFLKLVEEAIAKAETTDQSLKFENLVMQMMNLDMGERVPTTEAISEALIKQGWNFQQVSNVWRPSQQALNIPWSDQAIDHLGGKGTVNRVWHVLKSSHLTGFPKRPATPSIDPEVCKRGRLLKAKVSKVARPVHTTQASPSLESPEKDSTVSKTCANNAVKEDNLLSCSLQHRRMAVPGKKTLLKNKITWWLRTQESPTQATPTPRRPSQSQQSSSKKIILATPEIILPTPPIPEKAPSKRKRRGRPRKTPSTPTAAVLDPPVLETADGSPQLYPPSTMRKPLKIPATPNLSSPEVKKTFAATTVSGNGRPPSSADKIGKGTTMSKD